MEKFVSVALCTYNGEKFIAEQLDSLVNQNYNNLEIVIVDDKSTDDTIEIISSYAAKDARIKIFQNKSTLGFNKNFERAVTLCTGDYIAICDQDDVWLPDKLLLLAENMGDNWLIYSNSVRVDDKLSNTDQLLNHHKLSYDYKGILLSNYVTGHTVMICRELVNVALPFPENGYYDWWLGFVALYHKKIRYVDKVLTQHRQHSASVINKQIHTNDVNVKIRQSTIAMLQEFSAYKNLAPVDKAFILDLKSAYVRSSASPVKLIRLINKFYSELFSEQKPRNMLSRLNFARRYVQGLW